MKKKFLSMLIMMIALVAVSTSCTEEPTVNAQIKVDHKITQQERAEMTFRYADKNNSNKLYKSDGQIITSISFYTNQLLPAMYEYPNGRLVVEPALTEKGESTVILTVYSGSKDSKSLTTSGDFGDAIQSFELGMSCPPYCP